LYVENYIIPSLSQEDKLYFEIKDQNDPKDLVKIMSLTKKINFFVISYTQTDMSFTCSDTNYLIFDTFVIILLYNSNYKILVKSDINTGQISWLLGKSNSNLQRLIRAYNSSCLDIKDCSYIIPDLKKIIDDKFLNINYGVIDPLTNKIIYLETDAGIIPIKQSSISYNIKTKTINFIEKIQLKEQSDKLEKISKSYEYLKPSGMVYNEDISKVTGIKTLCGFSFFRAGDNQIDSVLISLSLNGSFSGA
jgi:hypothetical protein